jgi:chemotaxis protein MotB
MTARRRGGRRGRGARHSEEHDGGDERWLLTYSDMITLLMALFMVMFAMSNVDARKFDRLQKAMQEAFSGKILTGGESMQQTGATSTTERSSLEPTVAPIQPIQRDITAARAEHAAAREDEEFRALKMKLDAYARAHGLTKQLEVRIATRGLVIRLLTDRVLFDSGTATLKPAATPTLHRVGQLLRAEFDHPIVVEGHTDNRPIGGVAYPTNWELSAARATNVVRHLIREKVAPGRLSAAGYGAMHPIASNARAAGQARNRRVEIVLTRLRSRA